MTSLFLLLLLTVLLPFRRGDDRHTCGRGFVTGISIGTPATRAVVISVAILMIFLSLLCHFGRTLVCGPQCIGPDLSPSCRGERCSRSSSSSSSIVSSFTVSTTKRHFLIRLAAEVLVAEDDDVVCQCCFVCCC